MLVTGVVISAYCLRCTTLEVLTPNVALGLKASVAPRTLSAYNFESSLGKWVDLQHVRFSGFVRECFGDLGC